MLSKSLLSLAIAASMVAMSGCDISSTTANDGALSESQEKHEATMATREGRVAPLFDVLNSVLPLGSDLVFADAAGSDGTANVGGDGTNPGFDAINDLDGGLSTLAPIDIAMDGSLDPATVIAGTNVFLVKLPNSSDAQSLVLPLIELDENGSFVGAYNASATLDTGHTQRQMTALDLDALNVATIAVLFSQLKADGTAPASAAETVAGQNLGSIVADQPVAGTDYSASVITLGTTEDNTIRIAPLLPLDAKSKYITIVTNGVTALDGQALLESVSYEYISGEATVFTAVLNPVQAALQAWESLAATILGTAGKNVTLTNATAGTVNNIVFSSAATTVDPSTVLKSMAYPGYWAASAVVQNNETVAAGILAGAVAQGSLDQATVDFVTANGAAISTAAGVVSGALTTDAGAGIAYEHPRARSFEIIKDAGGLGVHQIPVSSLSAGAITDNVLVSQGAIELPQYLDAMATDASDYWEGSAAVGGVLDVLAGNAAGTTPPSDVTGEKNVTYRFPFAAEKRDAVVPIMMFEPIDNTVAAFLADNDGDGSTSAATYMTTANAGAGCVKPAGGWPVTIIQHGFTSERTGNMINASKIANLTCHALVAMDLPHHGIAATNSRLGLGVDYDDGLAADGDNSTTTATPFAAAKAAHVAATAADATILDSLAERHESFYGVGGVPTTPMNYGETKAGDSGSLWIRLDNFQRGRDNMRQGVMDLLNLNATLATIDINGDGTVPDFDVTNVNYIGHSLGGIIGTTFVAVNNDATVQAGNTSLPKVQKAILATPGGSIAKMVESSVAIGPQIIGGLAANMVAQGTSTFESFIQIFQATLDSADPMNFISDLKTNGSSETPTLIIEMVGSTAGGTPTDLVVPNNGVGGFLASGAARPESAQSPFIGTDPMISLLAAENVVDTPTGNKLVAKYNEGGHGTFSSAGSDTSATGFDSATAYAEMLSQSVQFLLSGAITPANTGILVSDVTP